jgi:acyl-CoA synthetase (AMP-forming)/AMP-acid ligase II
VLGPTFHSPGADAYRRPGGAWDQPSLDELLTARASDELAHRVARVAGGLREQGVEPGDAVAWQSANRDEIDVLYRACWRLGAIAAPLHHQLGAQEVERSRRAVAPRVVVEDLDALPEGMPVTDVWTEREQLAAVLFTSGSSGTPKGVLHTQATLAYKAALMADVHGMRTDDCVLMPAPGAHISGLLNGITLPGAVPFRTVFMARWDPEVALELIERERVTFMIGPPTFFVSLMQAPGFAPERVESLRLISSGGAGVSVAFVEEASATLGAVVKRTYGSTEAPTIATSTGTDEADAAHTHDGHAIGAVEMRIVDGELLVRGPEVCVGYLDADQNVGAFDAEGWFHTGDLATLTSPEDDGGGWLNIVGRLKDVIIRGGENISTAEVEHELEAHADVRQAVVVGYPDDLMGERVAAFVVGAESFDVTGARAWFAARGVARFKTPERIVVVDAIPTLPTGKPDRDALRSQLSRPA